MSSGEDRATTVKGLAMAAGFDVVGIAAMDPLEDRDRHAYEAWLDAGRHGSMDYMNRTRDRRLNPEEVLTGVRSIVCVALNYWDGNERVSPGAGRGEVARYARGRDYHKVFTRRLGVLEGDLIKTFPGVATRRYVDTGPVLEKLWAERAGVGWRGKHTNLLSRDWGSWLLLGEVLTDLDLAGDAPGVDHCGECTRCIDICPTGAITGPYQLDATRCISYLTIEHRGSIPEELRPLMGSHVFGCDECLDVCPWNRFAAPAQEPDFKTREGMIAPFLVELVSMDDAGFLMRFAGTAVMRAKREGLARNACIALGNVGGTGAVEALRLAMNDTSSIVREHAAWGLNQLLR